MREHTVALARALGVVGLINVQYALKDGVVYACSKDRCVYALDAEKGTGTARTS